MRPLGRHRIHAEEHKDVVTVSSIEDGHILSEGRRAAVERRSNATHRTQQIAKEPTVNLRRHAKGVHSSGGRGN
jgi:hypothetical protein